MPWPLPEGLDDDELEKKLYPPPPVPSDRERPEPDWREFSWRQTLEIVEAEAGNLNRALA